MKRIRENFGGIILCLGQLLVGILLMINPAGFTSGIIIAVGAVLLLAGIISVIRYFRTPPVAAAAQKGLAKGICGIAAGLFCILNSRWFLTVFPLLTMLYGVGILLTAVMRIQWTADLLRQKKAQWKWSAIGAAASLAFALVILLNTFASVTFLWIFVGVSLIIDAVLDVMALIFNGKQAVNP